MTKREGLKPFLWGAVLGSLALTIAAFSAGWIVSSGARDEQVKAAAIDAQARICVAMAQAHRTATADATDLSGMQARDAREALAKTFAIALPGEEGVNPAVLRVCASMLDKPSI
jgi:hypothetical protein